MPRQLEGIKKFDDGVPEQEKLRDELFLENMAAVAGTMAATNAWRQKITTRTAGVPGVNSTSYAGCAAASPGLARGSP